MQKIKSINEPKKEAKLSAFPYQRQAFEFLKELEYAAIFHEQGLGKTKIAIDLILYWLKLEVVDTVLIVTKKQLILNWISELDTHTFIKPAVLTTNKLDNFYILNGTSRVVLANFELMISEEERLKMFLKTKDVAIIIDESAKIKDPKSKVAQSLFALSDDFKRKVIMTGTPVANRPYDIWSQIFFLDKGKALGDDFSKFREANDLTNTLYKNEQEAILLEQSLGEIFSKVSSFCVRETKKSGVIHLPNKEFVDVKVQMNTAQKQMYEKLRNELYLLVEKNDTTVIDNSNVVLKRLLRLIQIASNPRLVDDLYGEMSCKETKLRQLLEEIISKNEKAIVWTNYIENVDYLSTRNKDLGSVKIHGKMPISDRYKSIKSFKENPKIHLLFATPASSKEGLTLTVANHVIFFDRSLSLDDYLQAQDRIHRISQQKTCYIYNIIAEDTIDVWVDSLLKAKENAAHLVQGDCSVEEYSNRISYNFGQIVKEILKGDNINE